MNQSAEQTISIPNASEPGLSQAVEARANFWKYPEDSDCTVTLKIGSKDKEVARRFNRRTGAKVYEVLAALLILVCAGCWNITGANKEKAELEASRWAKASSKAGVDISFTPGSCNRHDRDGDGYVSCTFILAGEPRTFECAGVSLLDNNEGCREPKMKLRRY